MYIILRRRHIAAALCACLALILVPAAAVRLAGQPAAAAAAKATDNWGLSVPNPGDPPVGNAAPAYLRQFDAYFLGDTAQKRIYLTFDCGFENGHTPAILDALKKHGVKATFFVVGHYLESSPDLVRRMVEEGHTVGNHTYHHPDMSKIADPAAFQEEIQSLEALYKEVTGQEMVKLYRPPQGKYSESNLKMAQQLGYKTFFWSLAYVDWYTEKQPTAQQAFDKLLPRIHNGAVVLLHNTSATNAAILDELLTKWEQAGFTFGSLTDF